MKLLVIGGTEFVGRAFVEDAAARGHDVTIFHRGLREPSDLVVPNLAPPRHVHGDRDGGLGALGDESFDAVLDTCGYVPRIVEASARALAGRAGRYLFVSTSSAYPDDVAPGANEDSPIHPPPYPDTEEVTDESYGPLKVGCELAVHAAFGEGAVVVRPGYIVGPHDPTERFVSWLRRAAAGRPIAAPGPPDEPLQVVDVRDLAAFMVDLLERGTAGTFGVFGPGEPISTRIMLETAIAEARAPTTLVWADRDVALAVGDEKERYRLFPMWHPEYPGVNRFDVSRAIAAGLRHRPFAETVRDTIAWDRARPQAPLPFGPTPDEERELLAAWRD